MSNGHVTGFHVRVGVLVVDRLRTGDAVNAGSVTLQVRLKLNGLSLASSLLNETVPVIAPSTVASQLRTNVVDSSGAMVAEPKFPTEKLPVVFGGFVEIVRSSRPSLRTVMVRLMGMPDGVVPRLNAPPSGMLTPSGP